MSTPAHAVHASTYYTHYHILHKLKHDAHTNTCYIATHTITCHTYWYTPNTLAYAGHTC